MKKITLFSHDGCKACHKLKEVLDKENITYKVIDVIKHTPLWKTVQKEEDNLKFTPTLCVESYLEKTRKFLSAGRDFENETEGLEKLKNLL